ncbi:MAG: hypothetical protein CM1200mP10_03460 [Candidatus Neomarinimicrobiota bacterium]|nr:MAG: hypothetical protein CM1200mP10_03460 [Candidatus Neomarinimicrobiota bacterium]
MEHRLCRWQWSIRRGKNSDNDIFRWWKKSFSLSGNHLGEELADSDLFNHYLEMRYAGFRSGGILRGLKVTRLV